MSSSKKHDPSPIPSLTPQRKHRKLLKDGSGTEVWPESIESIFVQGLREYWDSPWATYSQSRGRSRWRNQFLVDYLQKAGITRTKKQVASHIQVLRNMWKGEPEFYLVAGGEESLPETNVDPVKLEDHASSLIPLEFDENDGSSSNSTSPDFSPPDFQLDFPPTPGLPYGGRTLDPHTYPFKESPEPYAYPRDLIMTPSIPNSFSIYPTEALHHSQEHLPFQHTHYPLTASMSTTYSQSSSRASARDHVPSPNNVRELNSHVLHRPSNRATGICLLADGMSPFSINLDALMPSQQSPSTALALKIKLSVTSVDDIRSPSTLHGFVGTVSLSRVWAASGKCITRVYTNNICISNEVGALEVSNVDVGIAHTMLPESSLSRCRWLDASIPTSLTQEILVDDQPLLYLIYDLNRSSSDGVPSADLLGYQNRKVSPKASPRPTSIPTSPYSHTHSASYPTFQPPTSSCARRNSQTSLSYALTPVNNPRHVAVAATSVSF
ncbi:hypothetical protein Hypma_011570 [Hypsizygus marmoreus]|uniref:TEA domain-containing protein n=1 Tax=Hypsizygus marmoreus TaxID=39966 RepID=A0A369JL93_HYPMA|nr:hypothetical protein Hypma_011570 [Hypsizygus marmoreus]